MTGRFLYFPRLERRRDLVPTRPLERKAHRRRSRLSGTDNAVAVGNVHGYDVFAQAARTRATIDAVGATSSHGSIRPDEMLQGSFGYSFDLDNDNLYFSRPSKREKWRRTTLINLGVPEDPAAWLPTWLGSWESVELPTFHAHGHSAATWQDTNRGIDLKKNVVTVPTDIDVIADAAQEWIAC